MDTESVDTGAQLCITAVLTYSTKNFQFRFCGLVQVLNNIDKCMGFVT
jgi:hypothetical protein